MESDRNTTRSLTTSMSEAGDAGLRPRRLQLVVGVLQPWLPQLDYLIAQSRMALRSFKAKCHCHPGGSVAPVAVESGLNIIRSIWSRPLKHWSNQVNEAIRSHHFGGLAKV